MAQLEYIEVDRLFPHPDNPRKELGDLSELADSIKANGVFQNLTVTPREAGGYTVVIGHRRLAAARLAGVETVPCVVTDMTPNEQIRTMLMENIQRSDLTVYEQAKGFQMMLDLGETVESIVKESGFSKTTVYNRLKIAKLDAKKAIAADSRGATIKDYMALDKLEDDGLKNKVLDAIGTANFNNELKNALKKEADRKRLDQWDAEASEFAKKIEERGVVDGAEVEMEYITAYSAWNSNAQRVEKPEDAGTARYYYRVSTDSLTLYRDERDRPDEKPSEEELERDARRREAERGREMLTEITQRHYELRKDFVRDFSKAYQFTAELCAYAAAALLGDGGWINARVDAETVAELLEFDLGGNTDYDEFAAEAAEAAKECPEYALLSCAFAATDGERNGYFEYKWDSEQHEYRNARRENEKLDRLYGLLETLGYELSDEEKAMRDGTHELFQET